MEPHKLRINSAGYINLKCLEEIFYFCCWLNKYLLAEFTKYKYFVLSFQ